MGAQINDSWTYAVTHLRLLGNGQELATGSGFFWEHQGFPYLVTNWHNFSGRDPYSLKPKSPTLGLPDTVALTTYKKTADVGGGMFEMLAAELTLPLVDGGTGKYHWYEHPERSAIDVAAIPIPKAAIEDHSLVLFFANRLESDALVEPYVSQDAFIVGYPLGMVTKTAPIPVWKRGTIATEPNLDPDAKPIIYVDAATREGMSGSLVLAKHILVGGYRNRDGSRSNALYAVKTNVVGIYSGRLHPDRIQAQLGVVWKKRVIEELLAAIKPYEFPA